MKKIAVILPYLKFKSRKGATLIEVAVATALLALIGSAMIALVLQSQAANKTAQLNNQATNLAEQIIEQARYKSETERKNNTWITNVYGQIAAGPCWKDGTLSTKANSCLIPPSSCPSDFSNPNSKMVKLTSITANITVRADVYIFYVDRGTCKTVFSTTYLSNYK